MLALLAIILFIILLGGAGLLAFAAKVMIGGILLAIVAFIVLGILLSMGLRHA